MICTEYTFNTETNGHCFKGHRISGRQFCIQPPTSDSASQHFQTLSCPYPCTDDSFFYIKNQHFQVTVKMSTDEIRNFSARVRLRHNHAYKSLFRK